MEIKNVVVTGGAGYIGSALVPKLLRKGYEVKVIDLFLFGENVLNFVKNHPKLKLIKGDIRNRKLLREELGETDAIIHLCAISNDSSFDLYPGFGKSVNYNATIQLVDLAKQLNIKRFIFASTSSVYGIKTEKHVTEDLSLKPITDYSKYKALSEEYILKKQSDNFTTLIIRSATVCGFSYRQRLDLTVNKLTSDAVNRGKIYILGGEQKRPNIHIEDITDLYLKSLGYSKETINGKIYNVGSENYTIFQIAEIVKEELKRKDIEIMKLPSDDKRSYHISSEKIKMELGFNQTKTIIEAISDLNEAFENGKIRKPLNDIKYYNLETYKASKLASDKHIENKIIVL